MLKQEEGRGGRKLGNESRRQRKKIFCCDCDDSVKIQSQISESKKSGKIHPVRASRRGEMTRRAIRLSRGDGWSVGDETRERQPASLSSNNLLRAFLGVLRGYEGIGGRKVPSSPESINFFSSTWAWDGNGRGYRGGVGRPFIRWKKRGS